MDMAAIPISTQGKHTVRVDIFLFWLSEEIYNP